MSANTSTDKWAQWLRQRRDGGDPARRRAFLEQLGTWRDWVLDGARLSPGDAVLDVGTGEGLLGFGALDRCSPDGVVTFSDISIELLDLCRDAAGALGVVDRCRFVQSSADDLGPIVDASMDAVMTRSVLIYVRNKRRAFAEFFRVLRPGGRISLFEPVNRLMFPEPHWQFCGYEVKGAADLVEKLAANWCITPDTDPMLDFDDRTLFELAETTGFTEIDVVLRQTVYREARPGRWEAFLATSPNPLAPTWDEAFRTQLTAQERRRLIEQLRPRVETGDRIRRDALCTVVAVRP